MKKIVFTGPRHSFEVAKEILSSSFEVIYSNPVPEELAVLFREASVFFDASMKVPITHEMILGATQLELIITATTGASHIDESALLMRDIPLLTLKGQTEVLRNLTPAAEHSWALVMACARKLKSAFKHVDQCLWERTEFPGMMLKDKTIGIIGFGRIGSWMARYANAFGMKIYAYDPFVTVFPDYVTQLTLVEMLPISDIVTLHVNLNSETHKLLDAQLIDMFKQGSIFINTSRGELVDDAALLTALESGRIASVGLDVLEGEHDIANNQMWKYALTHDNVIITPHIGGFCPDAVDIVVSFSSERIKTFFEVPQ